MKILYYFGMDNSPMNTWQQFHIIDELSINGIEIEIFNFLQYRNLDEANEELIKLVNKHQYYFFLTVYNENKLYISTIKELKRKGLTTVLWCCDSLMTPFTHKNVVALYDLVLLSQHDKDNYFKKYNANYIYFPYAANPYLFFPYPAKKIYNISFAGTPYGSRINEINNVLKCNSKFDLFANKETVDNNSNVLNNISNFKNIANLIKTRIGKKIIISNLYKQIFNTSLTDSNLLDFHDAIGLKDMNNLYNNSKLNLSIAAARNTGVLHNPEYILHLRNFEIPMSGNVQLCRYFDDIAECYEEDKEILFYRNVEELYDKLQFYLKDSNTHKLLEIGNNARKKSINEHSWSKRFKTIFKELNINYPKV